MKFVDGKKFMKSISKLGPNVLVVLEAHTFSIPTIEEMGRALWETDNKRYQPCIVALRGGTIWLVTSAGHAKEIAEKLETVSCNSYKSETEDLLDNASLLWDSGANSSHGVILLVCAEIYEYMDSAIGQFHQVMMFREKVAGSDGINIDVIRNESGLTVTDYNMALV